MDITEIIYHILSNLDAFEIVKYSSINKLFYRTTNNSNLWMEKLNHDFCYNKILSPPISNPKQYKNIYKKYYYIHTKCNHILEHNCTHEISSYLPIPKLFPNIGYHTQYYDADFNDLQKKCINLNVNQNHYIGIGNIKLLLFTKYLLNDSAKNLIKMIKLITEGQYISWYNIGLMIMQKFNRIELSETQYEKNKLWCYEIKIQFNTTEYWIPTLKNKQIIIKVNFAKDHPFQNIGIMIDHIYSNEKMYSFMAKFKYSEFINYVVNFAPSLSWLTLYLVDHPHFTHVPINIFSPLIGIFVFMLDDNKVCTLPFEFSSIGIRIDHEVIEIQQKEIFRLEPNMYYIPMTLWRIMEQKIMTTKKCCWHNFETSIMLQIKNISYDRKNDESSLIYYVPLCYIGTMYTCGKVNIINYEKIYD